MPRRRRKGSMIDNVGSCEQAMKSASLAGFTVSSAMSSTWLVVILPRASVVSPAASPREAQLIQDVAPLA